MSYKISITIVEKWTPDNTFDHAIVVKEENGVFYWGVCIFDDFSEDPKDYIIYWSEIPGWLYDKLMFRSNVHLFGATWKDEPDEL